MTTNARLPWLKMWMAALSLVAAALVFMWRFPSNHLLITVSEAVLIAGILALVVDPILKRDLLTEASRGIFIHLLGFEHHPQVKDKLKEMIFETKLLRSHLQMVLTVEPSGDAFWVTVEYDNDIINPTNIPVPYEPSVEWDMSHKPQIPRMAFTSSDGSVKWTAKDIELKESELGVQIAKPHKVSCKPNSTGVTYRVSGTYRILCKHGYIITYMGRPTLKTKVRVKMSDEYEVSATKADVQTDNYWEYNNILMRGDHITVRWRKRGGEWV